jgi:hypothetical protein
MKILCVVREALPSAQEPCFSLTLYNYSTVYSNNKNQSMPIKHNKCRMVSDLSGCGSGQILVSLLTKLHVNCVKTFHRELSYWKEMAVY